MNDIPTTEQENSGQNAEKLPDPLVLPFIVKANLIISGLELNPTSKNILEYIVQDTLTQIVATEVLAKTQDTELAQRIAKNAKFKVEASNA